jgi:hypothetical protein
MSDDMSPPKHVAQLEFTPTTTIDELVRAAFFVADNIDAPQVQTISPRQVNVYHPADGSMATIRVEARSGAWHGITSQTATDEERAAANKHYDDMAAAAAPPVEQAGPPEG